MYDINDMIPDITLEHINDLLEVFNTTIIEKDERTGGRLHFKGELPELSDETLWLFNFIMWLNKRRDDITIREEALFYHLPKANKTISSFHDFVKILKQYRKSKNVDALLVKFLTDCTRRVQEFYLNMISGYYQDNVVRQLLVAYLDKDLIKAENIYSELTINSNIEFPAGVRFIPEGNLEPVYFEKVEKAFYIYHPYKVKEKGKVKLSKEFLPKTFMKFDRSMIRSPKFFMFGFLDREKEEFYPIDYFESKEHYKTLAMRHRPEDYKERVQRLNEFLSSNILKGINSDHVVYAEKAIEILEGVDTSKAGNDSKLILCDGFQRVSLFPFVEVEGVIGGIVYDKGRPFGYEGWFNCEPISVAADLSGKNAAFIVNFDLIKGKHIKFLLLEAGKIKLGILKEILWDKVPFRQFPFITPSGNTIFIEKCILCGRDNDHTDRGLCKPSEISLHYYWKIYGPDKWFPIFTHKTKHRMVRTHWKETMINNSEYAFKGHKLVAKKEKDGTYSAMFKSDYETMQRHLILIEKHGGKNEFYNPSKESGEVQD